MASEAITYNKADLRGITRAFKGMDEQATKQAKEKSGGLVDYLRSKIIAKAGTLRTSRIMAGRIAQGSKVAKSSKIGEINLGYAAQKFSGGGTTQINQRQEGGVGILAGTEFGSNKFKQFPIWSGSNPGGGRGSKGYFIYPTLREEQPYLIGEWEKSFDKIIKEWT
jgi:hypothetical protein